jgi:lambda repressor-like predicted transcriptional regulator
MPAQTPSHASSHNDPRDNADRRRASAESFANIFHRAYIEASDEVRHVITSMVLIVNDPTTDADDRESCLNTLSEALFPTSHKGELGIDLEDVRMLPADGTDADAVTRQMRDQEATFADNLSRIMHRTGVTQTRLAELTGVGQPAIANMLARNCRPQRRTISKVADALGVPPEDLWPVTGD